MRSLVAQFADDKFIDHISGVLPEANAYLFDASQSTDGSSSMHVEMIAHIDDALRLRRVCRRCKSP